MKKSITILLAASLLTACAGANYRPLVDGHGRDMNRYESDLRDCQAYAAQVNGAAENAAAGAILGALFGAVVAAAAGSHYDVVASAQVGAVYGAVGGGAQGETDQRNIIRRCLAGRNWSVLS